MAFSGVTPAPNDSNLVTNQTIASLEHNTHRTNYRNTINTLITECQASEAHRAGVSAPTDKPQGTVWADIGSGTSAVSTPSAGFAILRYYKDNSTNLEDVVGCTATQTMANKSFTKNNFGSLSKFSTIDLNSYISPTGTAGTDNTAMTVKSVVLKANSLTAIPASLRIRLWIVSNNTASITGTVSLNGVTLWSITAGVTFLTGFLSTICVDYIDATHAQITFEHGANGLTGMGPTQTATANTAGFAWTADQTLAVVQTAIAATHLTVFRLTMEVMG